MTFFFFYCLCLLITKLSKKSRIVFKIRQCLDMKLKTFGDTKQQSDTAKVGIAVVSNEIPNTLTHTQKFVSRRYLQVYLEQKPPLRSA